MGSTGKNNTNINNNVVMGVSNAISFAEPSNAAELEGAVMTSRSRAEESRIASGAELQDILRGLSVGDYIRFPSTGLSTASTYYTRTENGFRYTHGSDYLNLTEERALREVGQFRPSEVRIRRRNK